MTTNLMNDNSLLRAQRYHALSHHSVFTGIDYLKPNFEQPKLDTNPDWRPTLEIYFVPKPKATVKLVDLNDPAKRIIFETLQEGTIGNDLAIKIQHDQIDPTHTLYSIEIVGNTEHGPEIEIYDFIDSSVSAGHPDSLSSKLAVSNLARVVLNTMTTLPPEGITTVAAEDQVVNAIPPDLLSADFKITEAETHYAVNLEIDEIIYPPVGTGNPLTLKFTLTSAENIKPFVTYNLELINHTAHVDAFFAEANFVGLSSSISELDSLVTEPRLAAVEAEPDIDYLAKDYLSFRNLMLNHLSVLNPAWELNSTVDSGIAIVEALAYAADHLSYYQDAVATEAYLGTARQRISVKRHARLLDYIMHEGVNARVWVQMRVNSDAVNLPQGTQLFTEVTGYPARIMPDSQNYENILVEPLSVFETMHPATFFMQHNEIHFYTWGASTFSLPQGATSAYLAGTLSHLKAGDVLIFKEVLNPKTGLVIDAHQYYRHPVRLTKVTFLEDPIGGRFLNPPTNEAIAITEIEWHTQDELPFELVVAANIDGQPFINTSVALGNIVLADHGKTVPAETLLPSEVPTVGEYRPMLQQSDLTFRAVYDAATALQQSATATLEQNLRLAYAVDLKLQESDGEIWSSRADVLNSQRLDPHFVIEIDNDKRVFLRFGDDTFGRRPTVGSTFYATYRVGNGTAGNIGADSLKHIVTSQSGIVAINNPLPAKGGTDPESIEQVRLYAPHAFKKQRRCVTVEDYIQVTEQHPEVRKAAAIHKWSGSWNSFFIAVIRRNNLPLDQNFKNFLSDYLQQFQLIGHEVHIIDPRYVSLDISLAVHIKQGYLASVVKRDLSTRFSNRVLTDGSLGFFHPDNFGFGATLYFSHVINEALSVPGVDWIDVTSDKTRFRVQSSCGLDGLESGVIKVGKLDVIQVNNDPIKPENGIIKFFMEI